MGDWRRYFTSGWFDGLAHPDSPAAGDATGPTRRPDSSSWSSQHVPHPHSPAGREIDAFAFLHIDLIERVEAVRDALRVAEDHAVEEIVRATGMELRAIADGFVPGLLLCLAIVAGPTALGAAGGAALGSLALGIGAVPGAVFGAEVGLEAGIVLLEVFGIGALVAHIGASIVEAFELARRGVTLAWDSVDKHTAGLRSHEVELGGRTLAQAAGVLMRGILQGIVAFLLAKGTSAAAARVPELVAKLRASRLGEGFATWVERNWQTLLKEERLKPEAPAPKGGAAGAKSAAEEAAARHAESKAKQSELDSSATRASESQPASARTAPSKGTADAASSNQPAAPGASKGTTPPATNKPAEAAGDKAAAASEGHQVSESQISSTGEPVDVATGKVFTDKVDLELPGCLAFAFGACGSALPRMQARSATAGIIATMPACALIATPFAISSRTAARCSSPRWPRAHSTSTARSG